METIESAWHNKMYTLPILATEGARQRDCPLAWQLLLEAVKCHGPHAQCGNGNPRVNVYSDGKPAETSVTSRHHPYLFVHLDISLNTHSTSVAPNQMFPTEGDPCGTS